MVTERDRLRGEVDDLPHQLTAQWSRRSGRLRKIATGVLVVVTSLVVTVAVTGVWARRDLLNTDRWVRQVGPVVEDPAVQAALGTSITDEVMGILDPEESSRASFPNGGRSSPYAAARRVPSRGSAGALGGPAEFIPTRR